MRAYSHQGHGPRADQTGRIHISDFRNPRTISLANGSRSIHLGHSRRFRDVDCESALPPRTDIVSKIGHVRKVPPTADIGMV